MNKTIQFNGVAVPVGADMATAHSHSARTQQIKSISEHLMTDESKLTQAAAKAIRAQDLLDNELLSEAFRGLEDNYTAAWRASAIDDFSTREKLFLAVNIVGKVRDHLTVIVTNGKLAQAELKELAQTAERRKRFGIV